jgi:predicted nucleic acid-binding protein
MMLLRTDAEVTSLTISISDTAPHHHDDPVIATAVNGAASYLVTRDHALLDLRNVENVAIVSPRDFLDILDRQQLGVDRP